MASHRSFALGILGLGSIPVLFVAGTAVVAALTYDPELDRQFDLCVEAGGFTCGLWYEQCQRLPSCNFALYWPPQAREQDVRIERMIREHKARGESWLGWSSPP